MTKKPLIALIILLGVCSVGETYAQKKEISLDLGYGSTNISSYGAEFVRPFSPYVSPFYQIGGKYIISANDGFGSAFAGLTIDRREYTNGPDRSATYLKVPIGVQLNLGRKFGIVLGGGVNTGILLHQDPDLSLRDFSFGAFFKAGPAFRIGSLYRIILAYQANLDIATAYIEHRQSPGGIRYEQVNKGYDGFIQLSLIKKIDGWSKEK